MTRIKSACAFTIATVLIGLSSHAMANDDCVKPKVAGISQDDMRCIGDNLLAAYGSDQNAKPIIIDSKGNVVLKLKHNYNIFHAEEGLIAVSLEEPNEQTGDYSFKGGFISQKTGKEVIPLKYQSTGDYDSWIDRFSEGLVRLRDENDKYGYLDTKGNTVIPFIYDAGERYSEGLAAVNKGARDTDDSYNPGKYGFINKTGKTVIPIQFDFAERFSEGLATVGKTQGNDMKYGVIDKTGKLVIPYNFDGYIAPFSEGMAAVITYTDNSYGFIDRSGKLVIPYQYQLDGEEAFPEFKNGKVHVTDINADWHCINTKGKRVACDD